MIRSIHRSNVSVFTCRKSLFGAQSGKLDVEDLRCLYMATSLTQIDDCIMRYNLIKANLITNLFFPICVLNASVSCFVLCVRVSCSCTEYLKLVFCKNSFTVRGWFIKAFGIRKTPLLRYYWHYHYPVMAMSCKENVPKALIALPKP